MAATPSLCRNFIRALLKATAFFILCQDYSFVPFFRMMGSSEDLPMTC